MANNVIQKFRETSISGRRNATGQNVLVFTATHECLVFVQTISGSVTIPLRIFYKLSAGQQLFHYTGSGFSYTPIYNYVFYVLEFE